MPIAFSLWFLNWFPAQSSALTILTLAIVGAIGLAVGSLKFRGISLGIPGVMFAGLVVGRLIGQQNLSSPVIAFVRDFGLVLFVYAIGVQVGPGFLGSLRRRGLPLNLLALAVVLLGAILAVSIARIGGTDINAAVGLFTGGTTNAPALGSAEEALKSLHPQRLPTGVIQGAQEAADSLAPAFAIAYPFGLLGVILAMELLRWIFRINPAAEAAAIAAAEKSAAADLTTLHIEIANPNLDGLALKDIPALDKTDVVISRIRHQNIIRIPSPDSPLHVGDVLLAVGPADALHEIQLILGRPAAVDLRALATNITARQILVTRREAIGRTVDELNLSRKFSVAATRVSRAGLEFTAVGSLRLQFGDRIRAVGENSALDAAAALLGNSSRELNTPRLLPIFIGILLGVILGSIPLGAGSLPVPIKLGLASGPMIVAIILARIGRIGPLIWYMPQSASGFLRELGIVLFLIAVGLNSGEGFFAKLATLQGLYWLGFGAIITLVPLLIVGVFARSVLKMNFLHVCGLLCGSLNSPSLAFTQTLSPSEAPAVAFATVYPLTMISRVLIAQFLILLFSR